MMQSKILPSFLLLVLVSATLANGNRKAYFAVKHPSSTIAELEATFHAVSDPKSPRYGHHLSMGELSFLLSSPEMLSNRWNIINIVKQYGIEDYHVTELGDFIIAILPEENSNHPKNLDLLSEVESFVDFSRVVSHSTDMPKENKRIDEPKNSQKTPQFIRDYYNVTIKGTPGDGNSQAIASFLGQYYGVSDLSTFQKNNKLPVVTPVKVLGPNPDKPGVEANLDIQFIMGIAEGVDTWFVSTPGYDNGQQEAFVEWAVNMTNTADCPWVHSISYGDVLDGSIPAAYISRMDAELMKLGARGRTVLVSSGDSGSRCSKNASAHVPEWPTSSPYVTSVGGTELAGSDQHEMVWNSGGGGFSTVNTRPSYQDSAVRSYLALNSSVVPPHSFFNAKGRAYPDLTAFSTDFGIVYRGFPIPVSGTSASTPTTAALISLLNTARIQAGKAPLGFLNPMLYHLLATTPEVFSDVIDGNNGMSPCPGYTAVKGWDPASGCGSLRFDKMLAAVLTFN